MFRLLITEGPCAQTVYTLALKQSLDRYFGAKVYTICVLVLRMQSPGPNDGRQDDGCPNTGHLPGQPVLMFDAGSWQAPTSPGDHSNLKRRTFFKLLQSLGTAMSSRFVAFEGLGTCIWGWLNPNYSYSKAERPVQARTLLDCEAAN